MGSETALAFPVIDFSDEKLQPGSETWSSACQVINSALESHGCFYARSNKIPMELCKSVFTLMEELFNLPLETKQKNSSDNKPFYGYFPRTPQFPLYESVAIEDPSIKEAVQKFTSTMWPAGYDHFCETLNLYAKLLVEMDQMAKRMVFDGYGVDKKQCDSFLESTDYKLRSFNYIVPQQTQSSLGLRAHTDFSFFTLMHQYNVAGLQVKLKNGEWIDIDPSPSMIMFMAGDAFKAWSNDRIRACEHRVLMTAEKERISVGLFSFSSKMIQTPEELVDEEHPIRYKPFDHYDYIHNYKRCRETRNEYRLKAYCGVDNADGV